MLLRLRRGRRPHLSPSRLHEPRPGQLAIPDTDPILCCRVSPMLRPFVSPLWPRSARVVCRRDTSGKPRGYCLYRASPLAQTAWKPRHRRDLGCRDGRRRAGHRPELRPLQSSRTNKPSDTVPEARRKLIVLGSGLRSTTPGEGNLADRSTSSSGPTWMRTARCGPSSPGTISWARFTG